MSYPKKQYIAKNILTGQTIVAYVEEVSEKLGISKSTIFKCCSLNTLYKGEWRFCRESEPGDMVRKSVSDDFWKEWDRVTRMVRKAMENNAQSKPKRKNPNRLRKPW